MKIALAPGFGYILFLLFSLIPLGGCSHLGMDTEGQNAAIQINTAQPSGVVVTPTTTIPIKVDATATVEPLSSPTPTVTVMPAQNLRTPSIGIDSHERRVVNEKNLRIFIPELNELPVRARYRICKGCENIMTNQEIIWSWGKEKADRYIAETGRINGWSLQYQRGSLEVYAPEYLTLAVQIYDTAAGASLAINKFNALQAFPENSWFQEPCQVDFTEDCIYIKNTRLDQGGREIVVSRLYFSYHNLVGTVTGEGWPEDVVPEMIEDIAHKMYQKMADFPLSTSETLTKTH